MVMESDPDGDVGPCRFGGWRRTGMSIRGHRRISVLAAAAVMCALLTGCSTATPSAPAPTTSAMPTAGAASSSPGPAPSLAAGALVARIRAGFSPDSIAATTELLAAVGVEVLPDGGGSPAMSVTGPVSTFAVSKATTEILAAEASAGRGFTGRVLDDLTGAPTTKDVLAWLGSGTSVAAVAGTALFAGVDRTAPVFTPLVLALFLADRSPRLTASLDGANRADLALSTICGPYVQAFGALTTRQGIGGPNPAELDAVTLLEDILPVLEAGQDRWYVADPPTNQWTASGGPGRTGTVTLHATNLVDQEIAAYVPCISPIPPGGKVTWTFVGDGNGIVTSEDDQLSSDPTDAVAVLTYAMSREETGASQAATSQIAVAGGYDQLELTQLQAAIMPLLVAAPTGATTLLQLMFARLEADAGAGPLLGMVPFVIPVTYHVCGAADPCASSAPSANPSIAGTWHGSWVSETYVGLTGGFTIQFAVKGTALSGMISITGTQCLSGGTISGTLAGSKITFGAVQGEETIAYSGTWSGTTMGGVWQVTVPSGAGCTNDHGSWQATR